MWKKCWGGEERVRPVRTNGKNKKKDEEKKEKYKGEIIFGRKKKIHEKREGLFAVLKSLRRHRVASPPGGFHWRESWGKKKN